MSRYFFSKLIALIAGVILLLIAYNHNANSLYVISGNAYGTTWSVSSPQYIADNHKEAIKDIINDQWNNDYQNLLTANFNFDYVSFPNYVNQSEYSYPNNNLAIFGENIFYLNDKLSITPGFRFENINTSLDGYYRKINLDAAGNTIYN